MKTITLYHGTNNADSIGIRRPRSGNTAGFYLTPDYETACQYGSEVLEFQIPADTKIDFLIRPIGDSDVTEWVVTNQRDFVELLKLEY